MTKTGGLTAGARHGKLMVEETGELMWARRGVKKGNVRLGTGETGGGRGIIGGDGGVGGGGIVGRGRSGSSGSSGGIGRGGYGGCGGSGRGIEMGM